MSTTELKKKLINQIHEINDDDILKEIYQILKSGKQDKIYKLTDEQISTVQEAQEQIKRGEFLSDDDAEKEIDKWLGEK